MNMETRYLIQLSNGEFAFEEVSKSVFDKRRFALADAGGPRYQNDNFIELRGSHIEQISLCDVPANVLALICRALHVVPFTGTVPGGIVREPTHIKFQDTRRSWLVEVSTGVEYRQKAA